MAIQLFVPKYDIDACLAGIRECLEKGWTGLGFKTMEIEQKWNEYTGLPHSHFLNSNTSGLHLVMRMFKTQHNWNDGDEVLTTPLTFVSTNHAIMYENLKPVFCDVDESLCIDPAEILKKITPRTRAVIFVGMGGNAGKLAEVVEICKSKNLKLILDAAHMSGTRLNGKHVGSEADCTVFSFQAVKNLPTADSGMICFKTKEDDERARRLTWLGINKDTYARTASQGNYKWKYEVEELGYKYHGNSIMAAIAIAQLGHLEAENSRRREIASRYRDGLGNDANIKLIPVASNCVSSTHLFQIRVQNRDVVLQKLNDMGIFPGVHYRDNTEYALYSFAKGSCPKAQLASNELISLPLHMNLTDADVNHVIEAVRSVVSAK